MRVAIILGSTRPGRIGEGVARWVHETAQSRDDAEYELLDIADFDLPLLDEPVPPSMGQYSKEHTKRWAAAIASFDAFVFVTPEYNHSTSGALKNAIDFLYAEWNDKVAGFVGYGSVGGTRAVEHLRLIAAELQMATVRTQLAFRLVEDFESYRTLKPNPEHEQQLHALLGQVVRWAGALRALRQPDVAQAKPDEAAPPSS